MAKKYIDKQQDVESNKILLLITLAFFSAFILMFLYRGFVASGSAARTYQIALVLTYFFGVVSAGCLAWFVIMRVKKADESERAINSINCLKTSIVFLLSSAFVYKFDIYAIKLLYVFMPVYLIFYFIFKIYKKELTYIAGVAFANGVAFYFANRLFDNNSFQSHIVTVFCIWSAVLVLLALILAAIKSKDGKLFGISFLLPKSKYILIFISILLPIAFFVAWVYIGNVAMLYGLYAMAVWLFFSIIFYTIELINN